VVSGDLYWVSRVQGIRIVAVIDCTGHGVPGALMSLIANNLVNRIIKIENTYDPGEILTLLHKLVYRELKQETSGNSDGMDVALVAISNLETGKFSVAYAGAKRPMHYVLPDGNFIVNEIEPDKMSIGGHYKKERLFSTKTIELEAGTRIYLATDGFIDQNDPERKRFGQRRFKELLAIAAQKSFSEQYKIFEKAYEEHRGNSEQRDDILVMGIEL
jgi:serine phosphatase RsbU (regulator of sigma subunit)